jgi:hypothetical protein
MTISPRKASAGLPNDHQLERVLKQEGRYTSLTESAHGRSRLPDNACSRRNSLLRPTSSPLVLSQTSRSIGEESARKVQRAVS